MGGRISIDTPLSEITLRKYEPPTGLKGRNLVRKYCLSVGLLQPGDSRDVVVDVLLVLLHTKEALSSVEIERETIDSRERYKVPVLGVAPSNIRRQLLRLRDIFIVEKVKNKYRIRENLNLEKLFTENVENYYLNSIVQRVHEYAKAMDKEFKLK